MSQLYDKDGNPISYLQNSYNPVTQENEHDFDNFYDPNTADPLGTTRMMTEASTFRLNPGDFDEEYDAGLGIFESVEDIDKNRVASQTNAQRATRAVVGGLVGGIGTAMKDIGYMVSPSAYTQFYNWTSLDNMNIVTRSLVGLGNYIEQASDEAMPIYEDIDPNSISSQVFNWGTLKGALNSSVGFMLPGMGIVKAGTLGLKVVQGGGKLMRYAGRVNKLSRLEKTGNAMSRVEAYKRYAEMVNPVLAKATKTGGLTYINGVGEANFEAMETHDEGLLKMANSISKGNIDGVDAIKMLDEQAEMVYGLNIAKSALNYTMMDNFTAPISKTLLKSPGKNWLSRHLKEMPQEMIEESSQEVFKQEARYQSYKNLAAEVGMDSRVMQDLMELDEYDKGTPEEFFDRMGQFYSSTDVIVSGIVGGLSGPLQSSMGNMLRGQVLPGARYREEKKAYTEQQEVLKEDLKDLSDKNLQAQINKTKITGKTKVAGDKAGPPLPVEPPSGAKQAKKLKKSKADKAKLAKEEEKKTKVRKAKEDNVRALERAHIAKRLQNMGAEDTDLQDIAKKQVYTSIIAEHMAKGTYEALKEEAERLKDTDAVANDMFAYLQVVEKNMKTVNKVYNKAEVLLEMEKKSSYETYLAHVDNKIIEANNIIANKEAKGLAVTEVERDNLKSLYRTKARVMDSINKSSTEVSRLTSKRKQKEIFREVQAAQEVDAVVKALDAVTSSRDLAYLRRTYPDIIKTDEYIKARDSLSTLERAPNKKAATEKTGETSTKSVTPNTNGIKEIPGEDIKKGLATIPNLEESEIDALTEDIIEVSKELAANTKSQKEYEAELNKYIGTTVTQALKSKAEQSPEGRALKKSAKREARRKALYGDKIVELPEEALEAIMASVEKLRQLNQEIGVLEGKEELSEEDVQAIKTKSAAITELSNVTIPAMIKNRFNPAARNEASLNLGKENSTTNGLPWGNVIKKDFDAFLNYIENITDKDFVDKNYVTLRDIFKAYPGNKAKVYAPSYAQHLNPTTIVSQESGLSTEVNNNVEASTDTRIQNKKLEESKDDKKRLLWNKNPSFSIAHLSVSYEEGTDETGNPVLISDDDPIYDIAPMVDPERYNGGEAIEFGLDMEYDGYVMVKSKGNSTQPLKIKWSDLKKVIFDEKGDIRPEALEELQNNKEWRLNIDSVYDAMPINITGTNGDDLKFLHNPSWISKRTVDPRNIDRFTIQLQQTRKTILDKVLKGDKATGNISKKIIQNGEDGYSYGGFVISYGDRRPTSVGVPNEAVMGIVRDSGVSINDKNIVAEDILNYDSVINRFVGAPVVLVPVGKVLGVMKYHAEPLVSNKVSATQAKVVKEILRSFLTGDTSSDVAKIYDDNNIDITTEAGARKALTTIIHVFKEESGEGHSSTIDSELLLSSGSTAKLTLRDVGGVKEVVYGIAEPVSIKAADLTEADSFDNQFADVATLFEDGMFLYNTDFKLLNTSKAKQTPVVDLNEDGDVVIDPSSYQDTVKSRTTTRLKPVKVKDSGKIIHVLQTIVEFTVDDGIGTGTEYEKEGIESKPTEETKEPFKEPEDRVPETEKAEKVLASLGLPKELTLESDAATIAITLGIDMEHATNIVKAFKSNDPVVIKSSVETTNYYKATHKITELPFFSEIEGVAEDINDAYLANPAVTLTLIQNYWELAKNPEMLLNLVENSEVSLNQDQIC